jgi:hypothetical protein
LHQFKIAEPKPTNVDASQPLFAARLWPVLWPAATVAASDAA